MESKMSSQEHKNLYWTGWCVLLGLGGILVLVKLMHFDVQRILLPCILNRYTGLYCPGCGGTRAIKALIRGDLRLSLYYHPIVLYTAVIYLWYMVSHSIAMLSNHKWEIGMKYRDLYLYLAVVIVAINFIVRNVLYLGWGILL